MKIATIYSVIILIALSFTSYGNAASRGGGGGGGGGSGEGKVNPTIAAGTLNAAVNDASTAKHAIADQKYATYLWQSANIVQSNLPTGTTRAQHTALTKVISSLYAAKEGKGNHDTLQTSLKGYAAFVAPPVSVVHGHSSGSGSSGAGGETHPPVVHDAPPMSPSSPLATHEEGEAIIDATY